MQCPHHGAKNLTNVTPPSVACFSTCASSCAPDMIITGAACADAGTWPLLLAALLSSCTVLAGAAVSAASPQESGVSPHDSLSSDSPSPAPGPSAGGGSELSLSASGDSSLIASDLDASPPAPTLAPQGCLLHASRSSRNRSPSASEAAAAASAACRLASAEATRCCISSRALSAARSLAAAVSISF